MKFTLNVVALALGVVLLWTTPIQSKNFQEIVLDVAANDVTLMKYLDVNVKLKPKTLSAVAKDVLIKLKVLRAMSESVQEQRPKHEQVDDDTVMANVLHIVVEVASNHINESEGLQFAVDAIALVIKCNALMYISVQLKAIKDIPQLNDNQDIIISQKKSEVSYTLAHLLEKLLFFNKSIKKEETLYQFWQDHINQATGNDMLPKLNDFEKQVKGMLDESCELSKINQMEDHIKLHKNKSEDSSINTFTQLQELLKQMSLNIPTSTTDIRVWQLIFNKSEFIAPTKTPESLST